MLGEAEATYSNRLPECIISIDIDIGIWYWYWPFFLFAINLHFSKYSSAGDPSVPPIHNVSQQQDHVYPHPYPNPPNP